MSKLIIVDVIKKLMVNQNKTPWNKRSKIRGIAIHHSDKDGQSYLAFNTHHVNHNDWYRIGYHYVINKQGRIYKCNDDYDITWHISGKNTPNIGICFSGDIDICYPTNQQIEFGSKLVAGLILKHDLDVNRVKGHREFTGVTKSCPGKNFDMDDFRYIISQRLVEEYSRIIEVKEQQLKYLTNG